MPFTQNGKVILILMPLGSNNVYIGRRGAPEVSTNEQIDNKICGQRNSLRHRQIYCTCETVCLEYLSFLLHFIDHDREGEVDWTGRDAPHIRRLKTLQKSFASFSFHNNYKNIDLFVCEGEEMENLVTRQIALDIK